MSFGLYDADRRYRRRVWSTISRVGMFVITLGLAAAFTYQIGAQQSEVRIDRLNDRVAELEEDLALSEQDKIRLEAAANTARVRYEDLLEIYEREVPTGEERRFLELVSERLDEGLAPDRLAFFIANADEPETCDAPETRRFIMPFDGYRGGNREVGFAEGRISVTGFAERAINDAGAPQGWYDPSQELSIAITTIGGDGEEVRGVLPLFHSIVFDGSEWRFAVREGDQAALVYVTVDRCELPFDPAADAASVADDGN